MVGIAVVKYGVGNIYSITSALRRLGVRVDVVSGELKRLHEYDAVILPGVGSYPAAMKRLKAWGVEHLLDYVSSGGIVLGICLGMQLLFQKSSEGGEVRGLGLLPGTVDKLKARKLPHMGWSKVYRLRECSLLSGLELPAYFYFMHSYGVHSYSLDYSCGVASYGESTFLAVVEKPPIYGTQFHPERSGLSGLAVLRNFIRVVRGAIQ
jgi:glutamine amidotransferase